MFEKNVLRLQEEQLERENSRKVVSGVCGQIFTEIRTDPYGEASKAELMERLPKVQEMLERLGVTTAEAELSHMMDVMDTDGSGAINKTEFCRGLLHLCHRADDLQPMLMLELQQDAISFMKRKVERLEKTVLRIETMHKDTTKAIKQLLGSHGADSPQSEKKKLHHASSRSSDPGTRWGSSTSFESIDEQRPHAGGVGGIGMSWSSSVDRSEWKGLADQMVAELQELRAKLAENTSALQGDFFSMGTRLEEIVSDARSEEISSQLSELAVRRRCMEFESTVASRLSACEIASREAKYAADGVSGRWASWRVRCRRGASPWSRR